MRLLLFFLVLAGNVTFQGDQSYLDSQTFSNHVFNNKIKTVLLHKEGWNLSYPVIRMNSEEKLILSFDLIDDYPETYYYTFIHCDKDWHQSGIFPGDYLEGFEENPIEDYERSFNTTVNYYHYELSFPNDRVRLTLSGNYVLVVYPFGRSGEPVLTQKFIISEDIVTMDVSLHRPRMAMYSDTHQQIDFTVDYTGYSIDDPYRNTYAFILQNGRWDNAKKNLKPDFYGDRELKYTSLSDKNIFPGGNEYRYFDIRSIRYKAEYIRSIDYAVPYYNIYLNNSEKRENKPYFYWQDFNGKYYIATQEGQNDDTDADYVQVYFTLPSGHEINGGNIYVSGSLNNWAFNDNNKMTYNTEREEYECTMLLKQGWYNYEYVFLEQGDTDGTSTIFEGSHYETENDYSIILYYRNPYDRYDRVIGQVTVNTLNNLTN